MFVVMPLKNEAKSCKICPFGSDKALAGVNIFSSSNSKLFKFKRTGWETQFQCSQLVKRYYWPFKKQLARQNFNDIKNLNYSPDFHFFFSVLLVKKIFGHSTFRFSIKGQMAFLEGAPRDTPLTINCCSKRYKESQIH